MEYFLLDYHENKIYVSHGAKLVQKNRRTVARDSLASICYCIYSIYGAKISRLQLFEFFWNPEDILKSTCTGSIGDCAEAAAAL